MTWVPGGAGGTDVGVLVGTPLLGMAGPSPHPQHGSGCPPSLLAQPQMGMGVQYLLLAQGQLYKHPPTQSLHVPWLGPQHGVEVKHGGFLLAQEPVAVGMVSRDSLAWLPVGGGTQDAAVAPPGTRPGTAESADSGHKIQGQSGLAGVLAAG